MFKFKQHTGFSIYQRKIQGTFEQRETYNVDNFNESFFKMILISGQLTTALRSLTRNLRIQRNSTINHDYCNFF